MEGPAMTSNPTEIHQDHVSPPGNKSHAWWRVVFFFLSTEDRPKVEEIILNRNMSLKDRAEISLSCLHLAGWNDNNNDNNTKQALQAQHLSQ